QQDTVSVRLENIEAANAVLRLDSGIVTQDFQDYLAVAEDLNLRIIEIVHANGAIFSGPGQVLQLREFHQASDELMAEVKGKLDTWRDNQQFPFPDVSDDRKAEIEASLTYPPLGSSQDTRDK
ncbi:MAG: mechanosensitive ion channel family protein, partial [Luminiphilus sp.]